MHIFVITVFVYFQGATKLGLPGPGVKLVLEVDGTEVDDDDILGALMGETMMLLQADEEWSKDGVVDGLVKDQLPGPSTPKHGQYRPDTPVSRPDDDTSISRPDTPVSRPGTPASRPGTPGSDTQNTPWTPPASGSSLVVRMCVHVVDRFMAVKHIYLLYILIIMHYIHF